MIDMPITVHPKPIITPEFRLYYDSSGKVLFYTCENPEGTNYVVIDAMTYAEARPDVRVINGVVTRIKADAVLSKLTPCDKDNDTDAVTCSHDDIAIIVPDATNSTRKWKMTTYEL